MNFKEFLLNEAKGQKVTVNFGKYKVTYTDTPTSVKNIRIPTKLKAELFQLGRKMAEKGEILENPPFYWWDYKTYTNFIGNLYADGNYQKLQKEHRRVETKIAEKLLDGAKDYYFQKGEKEFWDNIDK